MKRRDGRNAVGKALDRKVVSSGVDCDRESMGRRVGGIRNLAECSAPGGSSSRGSSVAVISCRGAAIDD